MHVFRFLSNISDLMYYQSSVKQESDFALIIVCKQCIISLRHFMIWMHRQDIMGFY